MAISTVDAKRRVVLPGASPGDVFDIQSQGEGRLLLVRLGLEPPKPEPGMSMASCLEAIAAAPLRPRMTWDALKTVTREP
jgi:bifunctional DNA-binding transcriptional regulator/antitoxin component of YhaV-PrlF toxin-antitoxin module